MLNCFSRCRGNLLRLLSCLCVDNYDILDETFVNRVSLLILGSKFDASS